MELELA